MKRPFIFFSLLISLSLACALPSMGGSSAPQEQNLPAGSLLFQDDFSNPSSGFDHFMGANGEGIMDYDAGGYRILVNAQQTNFWTAPRKDFKDVHMEVDVGKLGGPDQNRIGMLCRLAVAEGTPYTNYYFFLMTSDGYYGVGLFFNNQAILLGQTELKTTDAIKKGLAVNHLRADCAGSTLAFYVNGVQLVNIQDGTLLSGDVGLLAGTFDQPGVDIIFDNFIVIKP